MVGVLPFVKPRERQNGLTRGVWLRRRAETPRPGASTRRRSRPKPRSHPFPCFAPKPCGHTRSLLYCRGVVFVSSCVLVLLLFFSRMRSEGFSFNSWGSGGRALFAIRCFYVRNRPQPSATVRGRALRRCHWGKLLQVTFHGCVTCQFATLFHCDLHENDMSRKKRDAFRCTGAAFCEILSLLRSSIGISVWRVVLLGCWMWPCHWDLRFRVWHRSSVFVTSLS